MACVIAMLRVEIGTVKEAIPSRKHRARMRGADARTMAHAARVKGER
jgi:hypothetical protein